MKSKNVRNPNAWSIVSATPLPVCSSWWLPQLIDYQSRFACRFAIVVLTTMCCLILRHVFPQWEVTPYVGRQAAQIKFLLSLPEILFLFPNYDHLAEKVSFYLGTLWLWSQCFTIIGNIITTAIFFRNRWLSHDNWDAWQTIHVRHFSDSI